MLASQTSTIEWESQTVLSQIAGEINKPLKEIIRLIQYLQAKPATSDLEAKRLSSIMLDSSEQIESLIADIIQTEQNNRIEILVHNKFKYPSLYSFNEVQLNDSNNLATQINESSENRISKADLEWLIQLENTILDNLDSYALCVPWLADELAVSERQIFRKIEKFTGLTPNKYIRNLKLNKAKELLEAYTYSTVNQVSNAVGMKDPYYFSNLYKKEFGKKPKEYLV
jgi:AraC-like DNA-binding protein